MQPETARACRRTAGPTLPAVEVEILTDWCVERLSTEERVELVYLLEDPDLEFASPFVADLIPQIVAALL